MQRINTINHNEYLIIERSITNNIILHNYDSKTFEGSRLTLNKEQAKELVNKLQELIYENDEQLEPINKTFSQHDCCTFGHCPKCNESVSMYDYKCPKCKINLKWR
jgi:hypothetical protein